MKKIRYIYDNYEKKSIRVALLIIFAALGNLLVAVLYNDAIISYDSSYQYAVTHLSFEKMQQIIPKDYMPPLYYYLTYAVKVCLGERLTYYRILNGFAYAGLLYLLLFPAKELLSKKQSLYALFAFLFSDIFIIYYGEVRSTYIANLFATGMAIYSVRAYRLQKIKDYVLLCIFSVLAIYTHNFCVSVYAVSFGFPVLMSVLRKDPKKACRFILAGMIGILAYIPWIRVLLGQIGMVKNHYWHNPAGVFLNILFLDFKVALLSFVFYALERHRDKTQKNTLAEGELLLLLLFFGSIAAYKAISIFMGGIDATRYYSILGTLSCIVAGVLLEKLRTREYILSACLTAMVFFGIRYAECADAFARNELMQMREYLGEKEDLAFYHAHEWSLGIMMYYFPNAKHYISDETYTVLKDLTVFPSDVINVGAAENMKDIAEQFVYIVPQVNSLDAQEVFMRNTEKLNAFYFSTEERDFRDYIDYDAYFEKFTVFEMSLR